MHGFGNRQLLSLKLFIECNQVFRGMQLLFSITCFFIIRYKIFVGFTQLIIQKVFLMKQLIYHIEILSPPTLLILPPSDFAQVQINNMLGIKIIVLLNER